MPGSDFRAQKPSKRDKKRLRNIYANHPKTIVNQYFGFSSIVWFVRARNHNIFMPGSVFRAQKPSKQDKKRLRNVYANHPKTILYQYFGFSSMLKFVKGRNTL